MKPKFVHTFGQAASWMLVAYLSIMVSGCAVRPTEISPEAARALQTREFAHTKDDVARAVVSVLQEMHYTLENADLTLGVITAERSSERLLAPISRPLETDNEVPNEVATFCLVAGAIGLVALIFAAIWGGNDDDDDDDNDNDNDNDNEGRWRRGHSHRSNRHGGSSFFFGSSDNDSESYRYSMTVTIEDINAQSSRIRVTVQGQHLEGGSVSESGPVQDAAFYNEFYDKLQIALDR